MKKILFICTGNTCRSCMAEGIFKALITAENNLKEQFTAASAGISAYDGDAASTNAVAVLNNEWGIDISSHSSRSVTLDEIVSADIILTMTLGHKNAIISRFPNAASKAYTLKEFAFSDKIEWSINQNLDITDPFGSSVQVYKKCAVEIKEAVEELILKLYSKN